MNSRIRRQTLITSACLAALLLALHAPAATAQADPDEAALIATLQGDAGYVEKQEACRVLRRKGTPASVPALAALLFEPQLSHDARYALEAMPFPEAARALRDALAGAEGLARAGIVISIGYRRDPEAVDLLIPLLKDPSPDIAKAAAGALGRIATPLAVDALFASATDASEGLRAAIAEGLLAAADHSPDQAGAIYRRLLDSRWPMYVKEGAFQGWIHSRPAQDVPGELIAALGGDEPLFRDIAARIVAETRGEDATRLYVEALPTLPPAGQAALVRGLAERGDPMARPAITQALQDPDPEVRLAAVKALASLGTAEDVPALANLLASDDAGLAQAARTCLAGLTGDDVNPAIAAVTPSVDASVRAELIELLDDRGFEQIGRVAVENLDDPDADVRIAALRALEPRAAQDLLPTVLRMLANATDSAERSAAQNTLGEICARHADAALPVLFEAMNGANSELRIRLLRVLARVGGPQPLDAVLKALDDPDPRIAAEAVNLLSEWPTLDAAPHLLELAQSGDPARKPAGFRGYVRLAHENPAKDEKVDMLTKAMALAQRPEDKKLVLSAWGLSGSVQSLEVVQPYLDDPDVHIEAAVAMIALAGELRNRDETRARAVEALETVVEKCQDPNIRDLAQRSLNDMK